MKHAFIFTCPSLPHSCHLASKFLPTALGEEWRISDTTPSPGLPTQCPALPSGPIPTFYLHAQNLESSCKVSHCESWKSVIVSSQSPVHHDNTSFPLPHPQC